MKQRYTFAISLVALATMTHPATTQNQSQKTEAKATQTQRPSNQKEKHDPTPAVLNNFAHVVGGFIGILQDPNNPENVGANVSNMLGHMVNIAVEMTKRGLLPANPTQKDIVRAIENLDDALKAGLVAIAMNKTKAVATPQNAVE